MKNILIVDDEKSIRVTLSEWFQSFVEGMNPIMAENGEEAAEILASQNVSMVITDLNMPKMDGFELLAHIHNTLPDLPVMVMTAFGTDQIKDKVQSLGAIKFLDKPLNYDQLKKIDFSAFIKDKKVAVAASPRPIQASAPAAGEASSARTVAGGGGKSGKNFVNGINLTSFLQLIDMEKKTCTLTITAGDKTGYFYLLNGDLIDAETGGLSGEGAAYEIIIWDNVLIEIENGCSRREKKINFTTMHLLMEACRIKDERAEQQGGVATEESEPKAVGADAPVASPSPLAEFADIDGFSGAILLSPEGETVEMLEAPDSVLDLSQVGALANTVLVQAKKAVVNFGSGNAKFLHIEAEYHHILGNCLNEAENALDTEPGKTHLHLFLVLTSGNSLGMAKIVMKKVVAAMSAKFHG